MRCLSAYILLYEKKKKMKTLVNVQQSLQKGIRQHKKLVLQKTTTLERIKRGHNRYTNYHSYRKSGGRNWSDFKQK